jgi:hypothetical protein
LINEEDFTLWQFQVSTARGRIIGFWYETTFFIVLLDPLHNMQPSRDYDYEVDDCYPLMNKYDSLMFDIESIKNRVCPSGKDCTIHNGLKELPKNLTQTNAYVAYIDDEYLATVNSILLKKTFSELLKEAIILNT